MIDSVTKTDTVTVASEGGRVTRFSVNGGPTFDTVGPGATGSNSLHDFISSNFTDFNSAGATLSFLNVNQTATGGQNLRNLGFVFQVSPEPSTALLGALGMVAMLLRRRRA